MNIAYIAVKHIDKNLIENNQLEEKQYDHDHFKVVDIII